MVFYPIVEPSFHLIPTRIQLIKHILGPGEKIIYGSGRGEGDSDLVTKKSLRSGREVKQDEHKVEEISDKSSVVRVRVFGNSLKIKGGKV